MNSLEVKIKKLKPKKDDKGDKMKQGTKIIFALGGNQEKNVVGEICGQSHTEFPILGKGWIVKPECYPNEEYPYTHTVVFDSWIKKII